MLRVDGYNDFCVREERLTNRLDKLDMKIKRVRYRLSSRW